MSSHDEVNNYLAGLITVLPVQRRRPRGDENEVRFRDATFAYRVRYRSEGKPADLSVCRTAFMSLCGIEKGKVDIFFKSLKSSGNPPKDQRGRHNNHKQKLSEVTLKLI